VTARIGAALFLRRDFYERAATETAATGPAGAIVALAALARESVVIYEISQVWQAWTVVLPVLVVIALVSWVLIAAAGWLVSRFIALPPGFGRLLRCLGFAQTPTMMLATLASASDPRVYFVAYVALMTWIAAANVVAMRAAAATTTGRAVLLALPVFLVQFALLLVSRVVILG
jgi:hypothetical protein